MRAESKNIIELLKNTPKEVLIEAFTNYANEVDETPYRLLTRVPEVDRYFEKKDPAVKTYFGIVLDTETTGLDSKVDSIIELGMVGFEFDEAGNIYSVKTLYSGFEDSKHPLTEEIQEITGITPEMIKDQAFDTEFVNDLLSRAGIILAHNAEFDRSFMEKRFSTAIDKHWGCTLRDIDWDAESVESKKLQALLNHYGYFFDGHRAEIDSRAAVHLLTQELSSTGESALVNLLDHLRVPSYRIRALNAPFEKKDDLKSRGYHWFAGDKENPKCWHIEIDEVLLEEEVAFLRKSIYNPKMTGDAFQVEKVGSLIRYSERRGEQVNTDEIFPRQGRQQKMAL